MLDAIEKRMDELAGQIEGWACDHVKSRSFPAYNSRWYSSDCLKSCYCIGYADTFPCPHCMDYKGIEKHLGHPAIVAEYARHWRALLYSQNMLDSATVDGPGKAHHIDSRANAAYHLYAASNGHLMVQNSGVGEVFVKDKPGSREGRNAVLAMRGHPKEPAPVSGSTQDQTPWAGAQTVSPSPVTKIALGADPLFGAHGLMKRQDLYEAYKRHVDVLLGLKATSLNQEGDVLLCKGGLLDDLLKCPHEAGYVIHEQALVVKVSAKALLEFKKRRDEEAKLAEQIVEDWLGGATPVNDWMAAALDIPRMGHSMCSGIGYSQEPKYNRSGPRRR